MPTTGSATSSSRCPDGCGPPSGSPSGPAALAAAHFPDRPEDPDDARHRLAFEELFLLELALAGRKRARAERARARELPGTGELVDPWLASLPFDLDRATSDERSSASTATSRLRSRCSDC